MANELRTSGVFNLGALGGDVAASGDANWSSVVQLFDGAASGPTLTDAAGANNGTLTYNATATGDADDGGAITAQPNGTSLVKYDTTGGYVTATADPDFAFGTGAFTVETWVYVTQNPTSAYGDAVFDTRKTANGAGILLVVTPSLKLDFYSAGWRSSVSSSTLTLNTWHHIALSRDGNNNWTTFVDGTAHSASTFTTTLSNNNCYWGAVFDDGGSGLNTNWRFTGYMSDMRVTKGVARDIAADWTAGVYTSALPQGAAVAGATRPTRRWGGITGRSLVESTVVTAPWTPADITSATVVGWFDGENVNGGTSGNSGATSWVNQISGQNDLSFTGSPTVGTDNVRTISGSYLTETGTASFQQTADWRVFVAATIKGGSGLDAYYPLVNYIAGTIDSGGYIFWKGGTTFASYPNYNNAMAWGNFDNFTPGYSKTFQNNPGVYDFTASTSSPWEVSFDGGRDIKAGPATYTTQIGSGRPMIFGWGTINSRRLDAEYHQIVVIQGTLSSGDEEKLYGYLAHKAGSASDLPSSNSYQSAAPTKPVAGPTTLATTGVLSLPELLQARYGAAASLSIDVLVVGAGSARTLLLSSQHYASGGNGGSIVRRTSFA